MRTKSTFLNVVRKHEPAKNTNIKKAMRLFSIFFYIGAFTIGGGYAMILPMKRIIVDRDSYLSEDEFTEMFAISQITPGPVAINMATFIGYRQCGFLGSLLSTLGVVLPSLIIITLISIFFLDFTQMAVIEKLLLGILAGVAGEIAYLTLDMFRKIKLNALSISILAFSLIALFFLKMNPIFVILIGGGVGIFSGFIRQK